MKNLLNELQRQKKIHGLNKEISLREKKLLKKNMPIQKIIGFIKFDDVKIKLNKKVFIPRYETEELVQIALKYIKNKEINVLDLCCGSGYIALTIKKKTNCNVEASDISRIALKQTKINAKLNNLNIKIIKSNLFKKIKNKYDVIISNPPYIPKNNKLSNSILKYEPHKALFGGHDGNYFYKKIIKNVDSFLNNNGILILEISSDNSIFLIKNNFKIIKDINGKDRIAIKKFPILFKK